MDERQLAFEVLETAVAEVEAQKAAEPSIPGDAPRKSPSAKRNRGNLPADLPRIEETIEPASLDCPCGCGRMHKIGEDRSERLDIVPAQFRVIVTIRPRYACRICTDGVTQAPAPAHRSRPRPLPGSGPVRHGVVDDSRAMANPAARLLGTGARVGSKRCSRLTGSQVDGLKLHGRSSSMRFCGCPAAIASSVAFR